MKIKDARPILDILPAGARIDLPIEGSVDGRKRHRGAHPSIILADGTVLRDDKGMPIQLSVTPGTSRTRKNEVSRIRRALRYHEETHPVKPDPKPEARVRDATTMAILHRDWRECALCGEHRGRLSLHHISKHPRDDVRSNLVMLCGDGTRGCHGDVEAGNREKRRALGLHILYERDDVLPYLIVKHSTEERARAWISRTYYYED